MDECGFRRISAPLKTEDTTPLSEAKGRGASLLSGGGITPEQRSGLAQRIGRAVDFASRMGVTKDEIEISGINGILDAHALLREGNRRVEKI